MFGKSRFANNSGTRAENMWLPLLPLVLLLQCCQVWTGDTPGIPRLLLVSFDGFRWDYLDKVKAKGRDTPAFDSLIQNGAKARCVQNLFPTLTFPNHYSIVTGLYAENHGIIANKMYDPVFGEKFDRSGSQMSEPKWWNNGTQDWTGEPIWMTNERAGNSYRSGVFFWVGSEAPYKGRHPFRYRRYDISVSFRERVDTMIDWFTDPDTPINLGVLYFSEPDQTGHAVGPSSRQIIDMIDDLDQNVLGYLIARLKEESLFDTMNIIVTSDHGMADIKHQIYVNDYVDPDLYTVYGGSPFWNVLPKPGWKLYLTYRFVFLFPSKTTYADISVMLNRRKCFLELKLNLTKSVKN